MRPPRRRAGGRLRRAVLVAVGFAFLAVGLYTGLRLHGTLLDDMDKLASIVAAVAGIAALCLAVLARAAEGQATIDTAKAREALAERVAEAYRDRLDRLGRHRGTTLWLSWRAMDSDITQYVTMPPPRARATASGGLQTLVLFFRNLPGRRLVIAGPQGAGKSILATQLAQALLADPAEQAVPVVVPALGWHPEHRPMNDWLVDTIVATYPDEDITPEAIARLVRRNAILPILDDFDELPPKLRTAGLRTVPGGCLLVTHDLAWLDPTYPGWETWHRVIQVREISKREGEDYLHAAAPPASGAGPRIAGLANMLTTPLEYDLGLRRLWRLGWPGETEQRTLGQCRAAVNSWLADEALDGAYRGSRWTGDQGRSYLRRLARIGGSAADGIAWWQLHHLLPRPLLKLVFGVVVAGPGAGAWWALRDGPTAGSVALLAGVVGALLADPAPPRRLRPRRQWLAGAGWIAGVLAGFCASELLHEGPAGQLPVVAGAAGLTALALSIVDRPADPDLETCPRRLWRADAAALLGEAAALAVLLTLAALATTRAIGQPVDGAYLVLAALAGVGWAVVRSACVWYLTTLTILAAARHLPVRLLAFLADARQRGLVRRVGPAYEIRYPFLTERLTQDACSGHRHG
ncbi:NACHT domain-containing protein [Micromonospora carbonacea]|uniref:NACHT domain-containing protein n=1 Tax=Micromonospora carbonacea TaxID=47853 RepID=A0A1C5ANH4_9ACTN|nr:NACHT domain-containing protein [Micromonospora carbonacea]SCF46778.1 NACHT domain-containing protein [Micromonospora carbonacea]